MSSEPMTVKDATCHYLTAKGAKNVPPGYKQTEVGVIPHDWDVHQLGDIALLERGKFSARPRNDPRFFGGDIPFIQTGDVTNSNGKITSYSQTLNHEGLRVSRLFPRNTLFFTIAANIGDLGIALFETACPDSLIAISPKSYVDKRWLFYALGSQKRKFEVLATQNAQLNINLEKLNPYPLALPPISEQRAIAAALSDMDELIAALDKLIAKKRAIKTAAMQQLLTGKQRLPGFSGEWEVKRFGDVFQFLSTANNSRSDLSDYGSVGYIHYGDIHTGSSAFLDCENDNLPLIDGAKVEGVPFLEDGDLVMADASEDYEGVGKAVEVRNASGRTVVAGLHTFLLRGDKSALADGFKGYLQFIPTVKQELIKVATGISVYGISKNNVRDIQLRLPPVAEQTAIATILSDMDAEITALEVRRDKTQAIKQGMMQELLTGRTRLV